jgi:hypothetical protein
MLNTAVGDDAVIQAIFILKESLETEQIAGR